MTDSEAEDEITVACRTCDITVPCRPNDLQILKWFIDKHDKHETWILEPDSKDDFQTRLSDYIDDSLRRQRYFERLVMGE